MIIVYHKRVSDGEVMEANVLRFKTLAEANRSIDEAYEEWKEMQGKVARRISTQADRLIRADIQQWFRCSPIVEGEFEYFDIYKTKEAWDRNKAFYKLY